MKHVGLNVAADPLMTLTYTGVKGALVIVVADDPGIHSSQNEQDTRHYARLAKIPCVEPSNSQECIDFIEEAIKISEEFDTPVIFRTTTRIAHSETLVTIKERNIPKNDGVTFEKDPKKFVMIPAYAKIRHGFVEERLSKLSKYSETSPLNRIEEGSEKIGIITSSVSYQYCKEAYPDASILKLGITWPLPEKLIKKFAKKVKKLYVVEELDRFLENEIKLLGLDVKGKSEKFVQDELNPERVHEIISGKEVKLKTPKTVAPRPPVLCAGCGHRFVFSVLNKLDCIVTGDIGCYTLGTLPPLNALHTCVCMGASIGVMEGVLGSVTQEQKKKIVSVIGDSTFIHSGITGLVNVAYNLGEGTVMILDNRTTAMTGHQDHPASGKKLSGESAPVLDFEALTKACGVKHVKKVEGWNYDGITSAVKEALDTKELSVIIVTQECILLDKSKYKDRYNVLQDKCVKCGACLKVGCPAILSEKDDKGKVLKVWIDENLCVGCELCAKMCKFEAIVKR
jgi:indolepyruvate ferredoxin oxidoreductase alpha subunit